MTALPIQPNFSLPKSTQPRLRISNFGGSYKLRVKDGLNHMPRSWGLTWTLTKAQRDTLETFFRTQGGTTPFTWTLPTGEVYQCVCTQWADTIDQYNLYTFTASFEEDFT